MWSESFTLTDHTVVWLIKINIHISSFVKERGGSVVVRAPSYLASAATSDLNYTLIHS